MICVFVNSFIFNLHASLPATTKILTPSSSIAIENLITGSIVTSYDFINNSQSTAQVQHIKAHLTDVLIEIATEQGLLYATPHQMFFDTTQSKFVAAESFSSKSILITSNGGTIRCLAIKKLQLTTPIISYDLSLSQPHLFFSTDLQVLTHNYVQALPPVVASLTELAKLGTAIACIYFAKTEKPLPPVNYRTRKQIDFIFKPEPLTNIEAVKQKILRDVNIFQAQNNALKKNLYDSTLDIITYYPADIMGIEPDITLYKDMLAHPTKFGPIYPLGLMTSSGDVECALYIFAFDGLQPNGSPRYVWKLLGSSVFRRHDSFVKTFIEAEDKKQLIEIDNFLEMWWQKIKNIGFNAVLKMIPSHKSSFEKIIYGSTFLFTSLNNMATKKIPPSLVLQAVNNGPCIPAKKPNLIIYHNKTLNVTVIAFKDGKAIAFVGFYNEIDELDTPPQEEPEGIKTVEDILKDATPGRDTSGKTQQFEKPGSYEDAIKDLNALGSKDVRDATTRKGDPAKIGTLPNGKTVIARSNSSDSRPTLEIQGQDSQTGKSYIKIRYGNK